MNSITPPNSSGFQNLSGKKLLYFVTAFVCIIMTSAVAIILLNRIVIGGVTYKTIINHTDSIENIAIINSDIYQILNEVRPIMQDTDKSSAITVARVLTLDIDRRFVTLQELVTSPGRKELVNKVFLVWKEYKKTLMEEIIPASAKGDKLKIAYLTTGIQSQRYGSMNKNLANLTSLLRQDITDTETLSISDKTINMSITALLTTILLGMIACSFRRKSINPIKPTQENITLAPSEPLSKFSAGVEELTGICVKLNAASTNLTTGTDNQKTIVCKLADQTNDILKSSDLLSESLKKLSAWSNCNLASVPTLETMCRESVQTTDRLESLAGQIRKTVSESAAGNNAFQSHISTIQNDVSNIASSMVYMDAGIKLIHCNTVETSRNSDDFSHEAESGKQLGEDAISSIQEIRISAQVTTEAVERLSLQAREITRIITAIDDVAEQIGLLALNSSIIAVQNKENGKTLVDSANEIRISSELIGKFTHEVATIIQEIQKETRLAVDGICKMEENIVIGERFSKRSGLMMDRIADNMRQISSQVKSIADANSVRAGESHEIKDKIMALSKAIEDLTVSTEEPSEICEELALNAGQIDEVTSVLRAATHEQLDCIGVFSASAYEATGLTSQAFELGTGLNKLCMEISGNTDILSKSTASTEEALIEVKNAAMDFTTSIETIKKNVSFSSI